MRIKKDLAKVYLVLKIKPPKLNQTTSIFLSYLFINLFIFFHGIADCDSKVTNYKKNCVIL